MNHDELQAQHAELLATISELLKESKVDMALVSALKTESDAIFSKMFNIRQLKTKESGDA